MTDEERIESMISELEGGYIGYGNMHDDDDRGIELIIESLRYRQQLHNKAYDEGYNAGYNQCELDWQRRLNEQDETVQPFDSKDDKRISDLGLSVRTYNALRRSGIDTVHELRLILENDDIYKLHGIGKRCVLEIMEKVGRL